MEEKQQIVLLYKNETSLKEINRKTHINRSVIKKVLQENNVKLRNFEESRYRKYSIDKNFFDIVDTEAKAYFLGLMYADGCIYKKIDGAYMACISLKYNDKHILENFNVHLKSNRPLYYRMAQKEGEYNRSPQYRLQFQNTHLMQKLLNLGLFPRKTFTLKFPTKDQVPDHLIHHFIRGYFDGDGCISSTLQKDKGTSFSYKTYLNLISTPEFTKECGKIIFKNTNINCNYHKHTKCKKNIEYMKINGRLQCLKFFDWVYKDATIFLYRKYNKFIEIKNREKRIPYRFEIIYPTGEKQIINNLSKWCKSNNYKSTWIKCGLKKHGKLKGFNISRLTNLSNNRT